MTTTMLTRRSLLKSAAAAGGLGMPFVHGAYAAGKLSCGFWDHWVPGANEPLAKLCREWADREKVELTVDFITSQGDKLALTATAEGQARSGHDILQFSDWYAAAQVDNLEPVDDLGVCADQRARQGAARLRIYWQAERPVDRGSDRPSDHGADPVRSSNTAAPANTALTQLTESLQVLSGMPNGWPAVAHLWAAAKNPRQVQASVSAVSGGAPAGYIRVTSNPTNCLK